MIIKKEKAKKAVEPPPPKESKMGGVGASGGAGGLDPDLRVLPLASEDDLFDGDELEEEILWDEDTDGALSRSRRQRDEFNRVEERNIITKAHEEAQAIRENAYKEGFEEGMKQADSVFAELREAIQALYKAREDAIVSSAEEIMPIAIQVAEKIIRTEVACDPQLVMSLVKEAVIRTDRRTKQLIIKVNEADVETVKAATQAPTFFPDRETEYIVLPDEAVEQGCCILETHTGMIDTRFSTQLNSLKRLFGYEGNL